MYNMYNLVGTQSFVEIRSTGGHDIPEKYHHRCARRYNKALCKSRYRENQTEVSVSPNRGRVIQPRLLNFDGH